VSVRADDMAEEIVQVYQEGGRIRVRVLAMPDDPAELGILLMDAARVCAEVYRRVERTTDSEQHLRRIIQGIEGEIDEPTGQVEDNTQVSRDRRN
jgi:hypothetical protein